MNPFNYFLVRHRRLALRFLVLKKLCKPKRKPFDLSTYSEGECLSLFRFKSHHVRKLRVLLRIPWKVKCPNGTVCNGVEGNFILIHTKYCKYVQFFIKNIKNTMLCVP